MTYNTGKTCMYLLYLLRMQKMFEDSALSINKLFLWIYKICIVTLPTLLVSIWIYSNISNIQPQRVQQYEICAPPASDIDSLIIWNDLILSFILLCIYIFKLHQITSLTLLNSMSDRLPILKRCVSENDQDPNSNHSHSKYNQSLLSPRKIGQKWSKTMRKSTILCLIGMFCFAFSRLNKNIDNSDAFNMDLFHWHKVYFQTVCILLIN